MWVLTLPCFRTRFDFSLEWYKKLIDGLLFIPVSPGTNGGAADPYNNSGNVQNTGIDASLTYHGIVNKDLKFDITGTFHLLQQQGRESPCRNAIL